MNSCADGGLFSRFRRRRRPENDRYQLVKTIEPITKKITPIAIPAFAPGERPPLLLEAVFELCGKEPLGVKVLVGKIVSVPGGANDVVMSIVDVEIDIVTFVMKGRPARQKTKMVGGKASRLRSFIGVHPKLASMGGAGASSTRSCAAG